MDAKGYPTTVPEAFESLAETERFYIELGKRVLGQPRLVRIGGYKAGRTAALRRQAGPEDHVVEPPR